MKLKKVLIVACNYPPINNDGVQRIIKFCKYLPEYGFESYIITCSNYGKENKEILERKIR